MDCSSLQWHDFLRAAVFVICVLCLFSLGHRFIRNRHDWNSKTRDYWFSLVMWSLAGCVISFAGIKQDSPFSVRLVFVSMAAVVSLTGLKKKGDWGGKDR